MKITELKLRPMENTGKLKAIVSIVFDAQFVIHDLKVVEGRKGLFVSMPSRKLGDNFVEMVHPLNTETREMIERSIFAAYDELIKAREEGREFDGVMNF